MLFMSITCTDSKCNIFSRCLTNGKENVFCRKHTPILQISGGIDYIYESMKIIKIKENVFRVHTISKKIYHKKYCK